jgi:hypothetical protein
MATALSLLFCQAISSPTHITVFHATIYEWKCESNLRHYAAGLQFSEFSRDNMGVNIA